MAHSSGRRLALAAVIAFLCAATTAWALNDRWKPLMLAADKLRSAGQFDAAATMAEKALATARRDYGPTHPFVKTTLAFLADLARDRGWKSKQAYYEDRLYEYQILAGQAELEKLTREMDPQLRGLVDAAMGDRLSEYEARVGPTKLKKIQKKNSSLLRRAAEAIVNLGEISAGRDPEKAAGFWQGALRLLRGVAPANDPMVVELHSRLADLSLQKNDAAGAEAEMRQALSGLGVGRDAKHRLAIPIRLTLARMCLEQNKADAADQLVREAQTIFDQAPPRDYKFAQTDIYSVQCLTAIQKGDLPAAETWSRKQLAAAESAAGPAAPEVASALATQAAVLLMQQRPREASPLLRRALAIQEAALAPDAAALAETLDNLGQSYLYADDPAQAETAFRRELAIRLKQEGPDGQSVANVMAALCLAYAAQNKKQEAADLADKVLSAAEKHPERPAMVKVLAEITPVFAGVGRKRQAIDILGRFLADLEKDPKAPQDPWKREMAEEARRALKDLNASESDQKE